MYDAGWHSIVNLDVRTVSLEELRLTALVFENGDRGHEGTSYITRKDGMARNGHLGHVTRG